MSNRDGGEEKIISLCIDEVSENLNCEVTEDRSRIIRLIQKGDIMKAASFFKPRDESSVRKRFFTIIVTTALKSCLRRYNILYEKKEKKKTRHVMSTEEAIRNLGRHLYYVAITLADPFIQSDLDAGLLLLRAFKTAVRGNALGRILKTIIEILTCGGESTRMRLVFEFSGEMRQQCAPMVRRDGWGVVRCGDRDVIEISPDMSKVRFNLD